MLNAVFVMDKRRQSWKDLDFLAVCTVINVALKSTLAYQPPAD